MEIQYTVTPQDLVTARWYFYRHVSPFRNFYKIFIPFVILTIPIAAFLIYYFEEINYAFLILVFWLFLLLYLLFFRRITEAVITKSQHEDIFRAQLGPHILAVSPEGISMISQYIRNEFSWNALTDIRLAPDGLYILYLGSSIYIARGSVTSGELDGFAAELIRLWKGCVA